MVARGASRLFFRHCPPLPINWRSMALNKVVIRATQWGFSPFLSRNESHGNPWKVRDHLCVCSQGTSKGVLRLRSCLDRHEGVLRRAGDGFRKAHAIAPSYSKSVHGSDEVRVAKLANGRGTPLGFLSHSSTDKLVVAVDVDEVLGSFLSALNKFIAEHYCADHALSEFYVYEFFKIWKCSRTEADIRVHEFFKTMYFKRGVQPIPGPVRCSTSSRPSAIYPSRQNVIKDHTLEWLEEHYPGLFQEIHFGNHFALDGGHSRPKSEICRGMGARLLIDDNPRYALECAEAGISVLLFDYGNSYPWSKCPAAAAHPLVTRVHGWDDVHRSILSLVASSP
ncbi:unnamed protein product [Spirodela intermedia]|uniref:Uncharacterized protein n=1 Tax=Spirodela intermedia TaxID=51605 RepID=A0A7I8IN18_SPIIN|nr:unnamed protein product [Spirodela intermedia]CAA6659277.1 unnamed protein product [Spirodela intermedia]